MWRCYIWNHPLTCAHDGKEMYNYRTKERLSLIWCFVTICRFFPPEIGCLKKLEELDLSFNKLKNLPNAIAELGALRSLKVASNKLVDLPSGISSLTSLEDLDLSHNRLTSLASLKLASMLALQHLNLQVFIIWIVLVIYVT